VTSDEQEALSRKYSNDVLLILPLKSGKIAVFNRAFELCGIANSMDDALGIWYAPASPKPAVIKISLEELGLI
jgi:hypothetical protein